MGEKWIHECIGIFIKGSRKSGQKRNLGNSAWFVDREGNEGNWWKKSIEPSKNDQVQRFGNKYRNRNNQEKIENEGRGEVNEGTKQKSDNTADIYDENVDVNHTDSGNEQPIRIIENDLSESVGDRLLRLREALKGDDFDKTEMNVNYGDKEKIKEEVIKINKVLKHVKITGFTHCRNVIQAAMRIVGEEIGMKESNTKKKKEPFWKRRILRDISRLTKDLSRIEAWFIGRLKKNSNKQQDLLHQKYGVIVIWKLITVNCWQGFTS